jgi:hypothetical protein
LQAFLDRVSTAATRGKETTMQLASLDHYHSPFVNWEKFFADGKKDEPPIECRLAVSLSEDAIYSLIDFETDDFYLDPELFGWDIRRLHGGGTGRGMFEEVVTTFGAPVHDEAYCDRLWKSFDRERVATDRLVIDAMDEAQVNGWDAPAEVLTELIKLRDMQEARQAARKAADKAEEARERAIVDAELDAEFAVYEKWIADGESNLDPLVFEHRQRKRCIQQSQFARDMRAGRIPGPSEPEDPAPKFKINLGPTLLGRKRK